MHPKDAYGMTNSVDPDQIAVWSESTLCRPWSDCSLIWVYTVCQGLSVRKLRIITVARILKLRTEQVYISYYYLSSEQQWCWSDCAHAQADLRLYCSHMAYDVFAWPGPHEVVFAMPVIQKGLILSSPEPKPTPFKHFLLRNHWADWSQISYGVSLGWGKDCIRFGGRSDENWFPWQPKAPIDL